MNDFLKRRPISEWQRFTVRDGQKKPIEVIATALRLQTLRRSKAKVETLHMTASLMALWFLVREHRKLGEKRRSRWRWCAS